MLRQVSRYIGIQYCLLAARRKKDRQQELTNFYSTSKNALVFMPDEVPSAEIAIPVVKFLEKKFQGRNCVVVATGQSANLVSKYTGAEVVRFTDKDVTVFLLPRKMFANRFSKRQYDLVIDLNLGFVPFAAYLGSTVASRHRVGFTKEYGDIFYSIQFRYIAGQSKQLTYNSLCEFLEKF
jgi:hypothetical protein